MKYPTRIYYTEADKGLMSAFINSGRSNIQKLSVLTGSFRPIEDSRLPRLIGVEQRKGPHHRSRIR